MTPNVEIVVFFSFNKKCKVYCPRDSHPSIQKIRRNHASSEGVIHGPYGCECIVNICNLVGISKELPYTFKI